MDEKGCLYVVSTPIGNLGDMTFRALETLKQVDCIIAEDTRHTLKLLNHFEIKKPMISYHEHNKLKIKPKIMAKLMANEKIALVSDAGTPGISDPGEDIIKTAIEANIDVVAIPGVTALVPALVLSGLSAEKFVFEGFLPKKNTDRRKRIEMLVEEKRTIILYQSPHGLIDILKELGKHMGNRKIAVVKELTKIYEHFYRGELDVVLEQLQSQDKIRGEFVIVVEGETQEKIENNYLNMLTVEQHYNKYIDEGIPRNEAMKRVAEDRGVNKKDVYRCLIKE